MLIAESHTGAAYSRMLLQIDLYVRIKAHMDPASDFNMLIFLLAFEAVSLAFWLKVCMVSKVTPMSLACFSRGT